MVKQELQFFNCGQAGLDEAQAAARLAGWHFEHGRRVLLQAGDEQQAAHLDRLLWALEPGSFWPHSPAGEEGDDPIAIGLAGVAKPNQAEVLISLPPLGELPGEYELVVQILPRQNGPDLQACRSFWKAVKEAGQCEPRHITALP